MTTITDKENRDSTAAPGVAVESPATPRPAAIRLDRVTKTFGTGRTAVTALDGVDLTVPAGAFTCVVGASGCGKTTLLHLLAGLEPVTRGHVSVAGRTALLFQESALFPWLTAQANVELALRLRGAGRRERRGHARELLELVQLGGHGDKRPHELSGGMRHRVALARALAQDADVLLMDEPFAALDAITRGVLHEELETIWSSREMTILFVTHDANEAVRLADRVVFLTSRPGRVAGEMAIPVARSQRSGSAATAALAAQLTDRLREEVSHHGRR